MPLLNIGGTKPDLLLLIVVSWSLARGAEEGVIWAFIGGLFLDILSGGPLGVSAIALMTVSLLSGLGEMNLFRGHILLPLFTTPVATLVYYIVILFLLQLMGYPLTLGSTLSRAVLPAMMLNIITMPFVHSFTQWLNKKTGQQQIDW